MPRSVPSYRRILFIPGLSVLTLLCALFALCGAGPALAQPFAIGDTLTVIQRPLPNIPAIVTPGGTLVISCEADPGTTGWAAALVRDGIQQPLGVTSASYSASTQWWEIEASIPGVSLYEIYDLRVTAGGGIDDTARHAVKVVPEFKSNYYFVHITDTHLPTHLFYYENGADTDSSEVEDLRSVIDDINLINPEFVLITGDYINEGELEEFLDKRYYSRTQRLLYEFQTPTYLQSGNHDIGGWDDTPPPDGTARRNWWRFFGWKRLDNPPPGAPWYTQNYSFDYGVVHYVGLEAYINYDDWRYAIYGSDSFTSGQLQWLGDDLAAASGSVAQVLFYHDDFSNQINLGSLGVEMALSGHTHRNEGSLSSPPYDLKTDNLCDGARSYRMIRVVNGTLIPLATMQAGASGQNLTVQWLPANDGTYESVTAQITNNQNYRFEHGLLRFLMPNIPGAWQISGGTVEQVDLTGSIAVFYVRVDIQPNSSQTVVLTIDVTGVAENDDLPSVAYLYPNSPNPFNPRTQLSYYLPIAAKVQLAIFDIGGRQVATLVDERQQAGLHATQWDGLDAQQRSLPSGIYLAKLSAGGRTVQTRKLVLAR